MRRDGSATLTHQKYRRRARSTEANPKTKCDLFQQVAFCFGSGRRIRTLTNRVRVCRATLTQSRYFFVALASTNVIIANCAELSRGFWKNFFFLFFRLPTGRRGGLGKQNLLRLPGPVAGIQHRQKAVGGEVLRQLQPAQQGQAPGAAVGAA